MDLIQDGEIKSWLKAKISGSHANNKSFLERIIEIVRKHPRFLAEQNEENIISFARKFRDMRNDLTHQNSKDKSYIDRLIELRYSTKVLVESIILSELEFDSNIIENIMKNRKRYFRINS